MGNTIQPRNGFNAIVGSDYPLSSVDLIEEFSVLFVLFGNIDLKLWVFTDNISFRMLFIVSLL